MSKSKTRELTEIRWLGLILSEVTRHSRMPTYPTGYECFRRALIEDTVLRRLQETRDHHPDLELREAADHALKVNHI